jgi:hypothetical protein
MKELIGPSKISDVLPLLQMIANEEGLRLQYAKEFKRARQLLEDRYTITRLVK